MASFTVPPEEYESFRNQLFDVIRRVEQFKPNPSADEMVMNGVKKYLEGLLKKSKSLEEYREKVQEKLNQVYAAYVKECQAKGIQPAPLGHAQPAPNQATVQQQPAQPAPSQAASRPPPAQQPQSVSQSRPRPESSEQNRRNERAQQVPRPPPFVTSASEISQVNRLHRVEDLRQPLERCRAMLRVQTVFGISRSDPSNKEMFMAVFNATRDAIGKSRTMSPEQMDQFVRKQLDTLARLENNIRPKVDHYRRLLDLETLEELYEMELEPLMLLDRYLHVRGQTPELRKKLETCSDAIGSNAKAKKLRRFFEQ